MATITDVLLIIYIPLLIILNILTIWKVVKYWKSRDRYKKQKFTKYVSGCFSLLLILVLICWFFDLLPPSYFIGILSLYVTTISYISLVRNIKRKYDNKKSVISEYQFLGYLIFFSWILFLFIVSFSSFYVQQIPLGSFFDGYFVKEVKINNQISERVIPLRYSDAFFYSGYTFFSMNYGDFKAKGLLNIVTIIELFIAQIAVIVFISILAGYALQRLKLNK